MIEIIAIIIYFFSKIQQKNESLDFKTLEIINSITLICLIFLRIFGILFSISTITLWILVTVLLIFIYIHNIKKLHQKRKVITMLYCNNCGSTIKSNDLFCEKCGHKNELFKEG